MVTTPRTKEQIYGELGDRIFDEIPYFYNEDEVPDISPKQPGVILDEPGVRRLVDQRPYSRQGRSPVRPGIPYPAHMPVEIRLAGW